MGKILPTRTLPANHVLKDTIDLTKDRRAIWVLNVVGLVLFLISACLMIWLTAVIRPTTTWQVFTFSSSNLGSLVGLLAWIIGITVVMLVIHEAIHGVFFWIFTRSRPRFGFRGYYAFAAAPDWYIPRRLYLVVALAPVVLMSLAGISAVFIIADNLLPALLFLVSMNFSGSVGDMMVAAWMLRNPADVLAQDYGDGVRFYRPA
jgi:hypothetical protein